MNVLRLSFCAAAFTGACASSSATPVSNDAAPDVVVDATSDAVSEAGATDASDEAKGGPIGGLNDRAGRAAIVFAVVDPAQRMKWNQMDTYQEGNVFLPADAIEGQLQAHLVGWDLLDGVDDWGGGAPEGGTAQVPIDAGPGIDAGTQIVHVYPHPLVPVLWHDALLVDTTKPFSASGYLEIEYQSIAQGAPGTHASCGGRWMNDDAVDKTASLLVKKSLSGVSDGVDTPSKPAGLSFPYLVAP